MDLPVEILTQIVLSLETLKDYRHLAMTCRQFRDICQCDWIKQKIIDKFTVVIHDLYLINHPRLRRTLAGRVHGLEEIWRPDGQRHYTKSWAFGKHEGLETWWYSNGQVNIKRRWKNDLLEGLYECWSESGQKKWEINYRRGKKHGLSRDWDTEGGIVHEELWLDDKSFI